MRRILLICKTLLVYAAVCLLAASASAIPEPVSFEKVLAKASRALQETNYQGLLTYEDGGITVDSVELLHIVREGIEYERLDYLNGPERGFIRQGRHISCVGATGQLFRGARFHLKGAGTAAVQEQYNLFFAGRGRVAGHSADFIRFVPKDRFRYGITLAFESETGLPVMSLTRDINNKVLERFQFIELRVGNELSNVDLTSSGGLHRIIPIGDEACAEPEIAEAKWLAAWLPPGFVLSYVGDDEKTGDRLMYTDGIATFSVFIKPAVMEDVSKVGLMQKGATTALITVQAIKGAPVKISLVGEVPPITAQRIAHSVRPLK